MNPMFPGASMKSSGSKSDTNSCAGPFCLGQGGGMGNGMGGAMGATSGGGASGCQGPFCISDSMMGGAGGGMMGGAGSGMMGGAGGGVGGNKINIFSELESIDLVFIIFHSENVEHYLYLV